MMAFMALSLWEPWATALVEPDGPKSIETRGWGTTWRGPIIIMAAQHRLTRAERAEVPAPVGQWYDERLAAGTLHHGHAVGVGWLAGCAHIGGSTSFRTGLFDGDEGDHPGEPVIVLHEGVNWGPLGADPPTLILDWPSHGGTRDVTNEIAWGGYGPGRRGWLFDRLEPLAEPIPAKGHQGLRPASPELVAAVLEQVAAHG